MRKAVKRELGRQKQAKNFADSIASGLQAQRQDQKARANKNKKSKVVGKLPELHEIMSDYDKLDALEQDELNRELVTEIDMKDIMEEARLSVEKDQLKKENA